MNMATRELLADYAALINKFGAESREARDFFAIHGQNAEFAELAQLSKKLKKALTASRVGSPASQTN
jgi:hypothetical protein